jgi:TolB-like protein/DNA-binding SARP family transcriptional activator
MSWFTIRNQPSSDDDRRLRQSASIMVATVLTVIVFTVAIVSGVTFVSSFAGPRSAATKSCSPHDEQNEMPRPITINLLGPFAALDARSDRLAVGSRRSRALLACLAMETGDSWTRPRLATLLWHNRSEQQGRSSLRQELVQLRKDLGVTAPDDWGHDPFVCLPKQILTDVGLLRSALSTGDALKAASIWRGDLLQDTALTEGPFADWLALSRSRLREAAIECFVRALRAIQDGDDPLQLEAVALKLVTLDPGNEEANRCLMCSSASRHDLVEVIERYRSYVVTVDRGDGDASAAMKQLLDRTIAVASREGDASTEPSTRWISEINRQHHVAAAPQPTRLLSIETATTLAVIPFVDLSPGAVSKVALADGLTEETTTAMARLPGVFVTARQSCMVYKNAAVDARTIASDLGVRYLLEGSIEVRGRSVRVNARLIDGRSGASYLGEQLRRATLRVFCGPKPDRYGRCQPAPAGPDGGRSGSRA